MGDTLIHFASRLSQLMGLWGCGDRGSDLHQIHGSVGCVQRTGAEPAALRMDVAELDIGVAHPSLSPQWGRGLRRVGEAQPRLTRSWVRGPTSVQHLLFFFRSTP